MQLLRYKSRVTTQFPLCYNHNLMASNEANEANLSPLDCLFGSLGAVRSGIWMDLCIYLLAASCALDMTNYRLCLCSKICPLQLIWKLYASLLNTWFSFCFTRNRPLSLPSLSGKLRGCLCFASTDVFLSTFP